MPHSTGPLDEVRRQASAALLRLVSNEEVRNIAAHLSIEPFIDRAGVIERLATLPRYSALAVLLHTATPTVLMLRNILEFLERHGVSARTTGCTLVLADPAAADASLKLELPPQAAGAICDWTAPGLRKLGDDPWRQALKDWQA